MTVYQGIIKEFKGNGEDSRALTALGIFADKDLRERNGLSSIFYLYATQDNRLPTATRVLPVLKVLEAHLQNKMAHSDGFTDVRAGFECEEYFFAASGDNGGDYCAHLVVNRIEGVPVPVLSR